MAMRTQLFASSVALVERVESAGARRATGVEDFSSDFQIAFPCRGAFTWHVGGEAVVSDPNQVLFIKGGEAFRVTTPGRDGFAEVIVTPAVSLLRDITGLANIELENHPLFRARHRPTTAALQQRCARFVQRANGVAAGDTLAREEELVALLATALELEPPARPASPETRRLIRRTKELLDSTFTRRLRLAEVANAVGASPAYLTTVFCRFEGMPLQRYVKQLRLARALVELPHTSDITALALDLGFSSHSHFTAVFRRTFGCPPSRFREKGVA